MPSIFLIEVHVPSQENEWSGIRVLAVAMFPLSVIRLAIRLFYFDFFFVFFVKNKRYIASILILETVIK